MQAVPIIDIPLTENKQTESPYSANINLSLDPEIDETERISKIPENIMNIRKDNVEFEKHVIQKPKPHRRIFKIIVLGRGLKQWHVIYIRKLLSLICINHLFLF